VSRPPGKPLPNRNCAGSLVFLCKLADLPTLEQVGLSFLDVRLAFLAVWNLGHEPHTARRHPRSGTMLVLVPVSSMKTCLCRKPTARPVPVGSLPPTTAVDAAGRSRPHARGSAQGQLGRLRFSASNQARDCGKAAQRDKTAAAIFSLWRSPTPTR